MQTHDAVQGNVAKHAVRAALAVFVSAIWWPANVPAQEYPVREGALALSQDGNGCAT